MNPGNKSFFITGASGFLGESVTLALSKKFPEANFVLLKNLRSPSVIPNRTKVISASLQDEESLFLSMKDCQTVLHLAAATHSNKKVYEEINDIATRNLIKAAEKAGVSHFVFISTTALGEGCGAYGDSKEKAESWVKQSTIPYTILRLSEVYGGKSREGVAKVISIVDRFRIGPYIRGAQLAPLYLEDAIQAIVEAVSLKPNNQTYILSGPEALSFFEVIKIIARVFKKKVFVFPVPVSLIGLGLSSEDQLSRLLCLKDYDNSRAQKELSFSPRNLEEGLRNLD